MVTENSTRSNEDAGAYATNYEHLSDELMRLDIRIHLKLLQDERAESSERDKYGQGMYITRDEVLETIQRKTKKPHDTNVLEDELKRIESNIQKKLEGSAIKKIFLPLPRLSEVFYLDDFERQCLIICLAAELDCSYEKFYAYLQNDVNKKTPSICLVLSLFYRTLNDQLSKIPVFDLQAPLLKYNLLQVTDNSPEYSKPLISRSLKLDDRIVNFLLDHEHRKIDTLFEEFARFVSPQEKDSVWEKLHVPGDIKTRIQNFTSSDDAKNLKNTLQKVARSDSHVGDPNKRIFIFYYHGRYGSGKRQLAEALCKELGLLMIVGDVKKMLGGHLPFEKMLALLGRESLLYQAPLCLENFDCLLDDDKYQPYLKMVFEVMQTIFPLTFLLSAYPWNPQELLNGHTFVDIGFKIPSEDVRIDLWKSHLKGCPHQIDVDSDSKELASKFHFTSGQIHDAIISAQGLAFCRPPEDALIKKEDLYAACRAQSNQKLASLARKVELKHGWDDIILPPDQKEQLREICEQTKNRSIVYDEWGYGSKLTLGRGLNVLFNGPSGTGKTLAAEIIANELKLDLYKIDLSQVVSKYIGETEKNLNKIFIEAETSNAILFFDEADALFGKRSEVKDAHDRYANIEVGYLLQKVEEFEGIAILATNLRRNMDEAFVRRIQHIVNFPFPDENHRRSIWETHLPKRVYFTKQEYTKLLEKYPEAKEILEVHEEREDKIVCIDYSKIPRDKLGKEVFRLFEKNDENIVDYDFLAKQFELAGGNIRNITINAAFMKAAASAIPEKGSSDFHEAEFVPPLTIKKLCMAIDNDKFDVPVPFQSPINTIDWLNELLKVPNFYDILQKKKPDIVCSENKNITELVSKTKDYRDKKFSDSNSNDQGNIERLNRLLLEETYPQETPSIRKKITMEHIIRATIREFRKMGKMCVQKDFGEYYKIIKRGNDEDE